MRLRCFVIFVLPFVIAACAGSSHPRPVAANEGTAPRYLEIESAPHVATLHFPRGVYTLSAEDKIGYYYRAPGKIIEHFGGGTAWRDGGIFVSKRNREKLRGYVYRAGAITHVGNFSGAKYEFREGDIPAAQF